MHLQTLYRILETASPAIENNAGTMNLLMYYGVNSGTIY
jgi:hypothetical protein